MKLTKLLLPESITVDLRGDSKESVIDELVSLLPSSKDVNTAREISESVLEREKEMTSGLGNGLAIPHALLERPFGLEAAFGIRGPRLPWGSHFLRQSAATGGERSEPPDRAKPPAPPGQHSHAKHLPVSRPLTAAIGPFG